MVMVYDNEVLVRSGGRVEVQEKEKRSLESGRRSCAL